MQNLLVKDLIDICSFHNNRILLDSIRDWLLANNLVLLIRAPFEHVGSLESCYKYWILVPERKESESKLVMIMLADRDDILEQNNSLTSALQGISKDSKSLEESQTYDEYMQFLDESKEFWGDPTPYNPWIYSSGLFNAKVRKHISP